MKDRPPVFYLFIKILSILITVISGFVFYVLYLDSIHGQGYVKSLPDPNGHFLFLPLILPLIAISLFNANLIMYIVPPLRSIAERYGKSKNRSFAKAQGKLLVASLFLSIPWLVAHFIIT